MYRCFLVLCLALLTARLALADAAATAALLNELAPIVSLQGDFRQHLYDEGGELLEESSGRFRLLRPGYFAWEIKSPDSQLVIADPVYLWHYDRELETVTRRPVTSGEIASPLQVLGGNDSALREAYAVERAGTGVYDLMPLAAQEGVARLRLRMEQGLLSGMEIQDGLGQRVVIEFSGVDSDTRLQPADFHFTPPPGADTLYYDQ